HQEPDLPVAGVVAERDGPSIRRPDATLGREDQELGAAELARVPPHAGVLGPAEDIAARPVEEHLGREGQAPRWSGAHGLDVKQTRGPAFDDLVESHRCSLGHPRTHAPPPLARIVAAGVTEPSAPPASVYTVPPRPGSDSACPSLPRRRPPARVVRRGA